MATRGRFRKRSSRSGGGIRERLNYQPPTEKRFRKLSEGGGGGLPGRLLTLKEGVTMFKPDKENRIRILPATWDKYDHWGYNVYVHYGVGPDNSHIVCPRQMKAGDCPICEEYAVAAKEEDKEAMYQLRPKRRVATYIIDRNDEDAGPKLWMVPMTVDEEFIRLIKDEDGAILPLDSIDDGIDILFDTEKKRGDAYMSYVGYKLARKSTPVENEDWLEQIADNPIPGLIQIYNYDKIKKEFEGGGSKSEEKPEKKESSGETYSWEDIHNMSLEELAEVIHEEDIEIEIDNYEPEEEEELADDVCKELEIKKPASRSGGREKLRRLRKNRK